MKFPPPQTARHFIPAALLKGMFRGLPVLFLLALPSQTHATSATWTGATDGNWNTIGNWTGGNVPGTTGGSSGTNTDTATFNNNTNTTIALDTGRNIHSILFDTASVGAFTLNSGSSLFLSSGGATAISSTGTGNQTFTAPITIGNGSGSTYTFGVNNTSNSSAMLTFSGPITSLGTSGGTTTLTLHSVNAFGTVLTNPVSTIGGIISDSAGGGATAITKTGNAAWALTGANTYSGTTTVSAGVLRAEDGMSASGGLGVSPNSNLNLTGGYLQIGGTFTRDLGSGAGQVRVTGTSGFGVTWLGNAVVAIGGTAAPTALTWGSAFFNPTALTLGQNNTMNAQQYSTVAGQNSNLDFRNPIALGGTGTNRIVTVGSTLARNLFVTMSGELSGDANLRKNGTGFLVMPAVHTYTGSTWILEGGANVTSFNSVETNAGLGTVHSASGSFGAPTTAANGTISMGSAGQGTTLNYVGSGETTDRSIAIFNGQTLTLNNAGSGNLKFVNGIAPFSGANASLVLGGSAGVNEVGGGITLGTGGLTKNGTNTWILSGTNSWSGTTTLNGLGNSILRADDGVGIPTASNVTFVSSGGIWETGADITRTIGTGAGQITQMVGTTVGFSAVGGPVTVAVGGTVAPTALTWGSATFNPVQTFALNSALANNTLDFRNAVNLNSGAGSVTRTVSVGANRATMSGNLTQSGAGAALTKTGAGTLILTGVNSYLGATTVSAGTLLINGDNSGATGNVTVASGATLGGTGTVGGASTLTNISAGGRLSPGASPGELSFTGNLTLSGASFVDFEGGDLIDVGGLLTLSSTWTLTLGTGFSDGGSVTIFEYGTATLPAGALDAARINAAGLGFTPTGPLSFTDTGSAIVLNNISAIPEPGTVLLTALGLGVLLSARRPGRRQVS